METGLAYLIIIVFIVLALNFYFLIVRRLRGNRSRKLGRPAVVESKQAVWRDKEVQRRIDSEQNAAVERVRLRNETLALYEEVRRRAAEREAAEQGDGSSVSN